MVHLAALDMSHYRILLIAILNLFNPWISNTSVKRKHFDLFFRLRTSYAVAHSNNKQIFHVFLFNIRNYSPEVINIQWREAELNIILPRVNNFNIKQKKAWNICFNICHQHQTRSGKIKANKTQQISVKTQVFFVKTELRHI